ncbi:MAG: hypothetical protein ACKN87_18200, partial [Microcystis aeruginosa]
MDAFSPFPPDWTENAVHAYNFCCPYCGAKAKEAQAVWINRRAPVLGEDSRRKWQEFYHCQCDRFLLLIFRSDDGIHPKKH